MSTSPLQQLAALNATPAPARTNAAAAQPAVQFGQTLSREIAQRQSMGQPPAAPAAKAAAPRPAEKAPAPRMEQGAKAEQAAAPAPDAAPARPAAPANNSSAQAPSGDKGGAPASDDSAAAAAAADSAAAAAARAEQLPMADMLALVASLTQPAQAAATPVALDPAWSTLASSRAAATTATADPGLAADAALAALSAPAMAAAAGRFPTVDGAPTPPAVGALSLPGDAALTTASDAAPQGELRALLEGAMPRAAGAASTDTAQGQATPAQTTALQTALAPGDAARFAPAARELPDAMTAIDTTATEAAPVAAPLQQAAVSLAQAANGGADKLSARVGTPAWDNQVGQKIVWMVAGKEQSATLTLNPPDLGPVQVVLNISGDNASVTFSSGELEVRQALENAMPKLREMMDESGISLGNASVNAGMPEQRQDQGERAMAGGSGSGNGSLGGVINGSAADANERLAARTPVQGGGLGLVDTFA
ncbi:flagellar hook-length control protein FliK [Massilia violaceinigra]|uniref:Flagellar hook-length control protein FliK n=1 Tax=Massilia violaceinigra TaxID=2045208 RepID=A0ABY4A7W7_9BURK|nr:flagellar hook-length control protein FliK [Massilia violaceinigra]UOD30880.1 flagellar hook-length control protein FliK [Massilia violaceinigra]